MREDRYEGLVDRLFSGMQPEQAMIEALRRARAAGVKTGLISNSWGRGRYDRDAFGELFDGVVISGEVGLLQAAAGDLRARSRADRPRPGASACSSTTCVENCEGAEAVGMTAVLHRGADGTLERLEELLGVKLR